MGFEDIEIGDSELLSGVATPRAAGSSGDVAKAMTCGCGWGRGGLLRCIASEDEDEIDRHVQAADSETEHEIGRHASDYESSSDDDFWGPRRPADAGSLGEAGYIEEAGPITLTRSTT